MDDGRGRSVFNLVMVGWRTKDFLDDALVDHIAQVKEEFENFDEEKLRALARGAVLPLLARFVPGLGTALLIKDLVGLGISAAQTLDDALLAESDDDRAKVARVLAGVFVVWAVGVAIGKLAGAIRRKVGSRQKSNANQREPIPEEAHSTHSETTTESVTKSDVRVGGNEGKSKVSTEKETKPQSHITTFAEESGTLRDAARLKGNFGLGSARQVDADRLGRAWVGEGYTVSSDGTALVSKDRLRQYRPPQFKPPLGKIQANFEQRSRVVDKWLSNGHLDIVP